MAKTDLEIAQECVMEPIEKVAAKIGIPADSLEHYGKYKAKLSFDYLKSIENNPHGKLVLVTAINPTKAYHHKYMPQAFFQIFSLNPLNHLPNIKLP